MGACSILFAATQEIEGFLLAHVSDASKPKSLWLTGDLKNRVLEALGQAPKKIREKYWAEGDRRIFILDQIGKIKDITAAWIIKHGKIVEAKVLVYRETRGQEVEFPFFTDRFKGVGLKNDGELDQHIDSISGATMSVDAMKRMARQALVMSQHLDSKGAK